VERIGQEIRSSGEGKKEDLLARLESLLVHSRPRMRCKERREGDGLVAKEIAEPGGLSPCFRARHDAG